MGLAKITKTNEVYAKKFENIEISEHAPYAY